MHIHCIANTVDEYVGTLIGRSVIMNRYRRIVESSRILTGSCEASCMLCVGCDWWCIVVNVQCTMYIVHCTATCVYVLRSGVT